ncbi:MAG: hypothetical protein K6G23_02055 [Lachnospiraceae bacterium]|nr:hypothetical protein [Lachnospiraceae bacterium]
MKTNRVTQNLGLKIISLIFAIAVWLVVVNINDPNTSTSFYNVQVNIENADVITSQGKIYEILDDTDVVPKVTVYGPRSVLEGLDKTDIIANADMNNLSSVNTIAIEFTTTSNNSQISEIRGSIESVKVTIENRKTMQLVLETEITGAAPDGYVIGGVTTDQNLVRVTGPESVVDLVDSAVISVDVDALSGVTSDITTSATIHLYDAEGNEVSGSTLTRNPESVIATIKILPTKEVPLVFTASGTPADGYAMTGEIDAEPATVTIAGSNSTLSQITEIAIPEDALNVTGQSSDMTTEIDIADYLPSGTSLATNVSDGIITVTVHIEREVTKEITINSDSIKAINGPENLTCEIGSLGESFTISITGVQSAVSTLTAASVVEDFDVAVWMSEQGITELSEGNYGVELEFNLPEGVRLNETIEAGLIVSSESSEEENTTTE